MSIMNEWLHKYGSYGKNPDGSITRTGGTPIYYEVVQALRGLQTEVLQAVGENVGAVVGVERARQPGILADGQVRHLGFFAKQVDAGHRLGVTAVRTQALAHCTALRRRQQSAHQVQQRTLAHAFLTQQGVDVAGRQRNAQVVDDGLAMPAIVEREVTHDKARLICLSAHRLKGVVSVHIAVNF